MISVIRYQLLTQVHNIKLSLSGRFQQASEWERPSRALWRGSRGQQ